MESGKGQSEPIVKKRKTHNSDNSSRTIEKEKVNPSKKTMISTSEVAVVISDDETSVKPKAASQAKATTTTLAAAGVQQQQQQAKNECNQTLRGDGKAAVGRICDVEGCSRPSLGSGRGESSSIGGHNQRGNNCSALQAIGDISSAAGARSVQQLDSNELIVMQKLRQLSGTGLNLSSITNDRALKFSVCTWLAVGNLPPNLMSESAVKLLLQPYGELHDIHITPEEKMAYVKFANVDNMERAVIELAGTVVQNHKLHMQLAPNAATINVKNLTQYVSNELLYKSFEIFGPIERACIVVDANGTFTGQGIVEFSKKMSAHVCIRMCSDRCFFITSSLRPCLVEFKEFMDEANGLPEETIPRSAAFHSARDMGPRFAEPGSFEHMYGTRWRELHRTYNAKALTLQQKLKTEEENLEAQLEFIRYDRATQLLRQELRKREASMERMKLEWNRRQAQLIDLTQRENGAVQCDQNGGQFGPRRDGRIESCPRCSMGQNMAENGRDVQILRLGYV